MRKKILLILGGILVVAFSGLTILTYHLGSRWFLSQFLQEKLSLARTVSSAVGGDEYLQAASYADTEQASYRSRIDFMRSVVEADPDITYLYTIRIIDGEVVYILDGKELKHSTIWIEEEDFSVVIEFLSEKEARFRVFQNEFVNEATVQYDAETLRFRFDPSTKSILVNDRSFLQIESFAPLQVQAPGKLLQTDLLEDLRSSEETLPGTDIEVDVYLGEKGEPAVLPGEPIIDDPQFLEFYKELIRDNKAFVSDQYLDGNYGLYMTVMAPILDSSEKSVGLTVIEVYDHKIEQFRRYILIAAIMVTAVGVILPAILIWVFLYRLVLSPVRSLFGTVNRVEDGDYSARSEIKTNDELGSLATGINHMVEAIEDHTAHLEEQVRLRTVDLQKARDRAEALLLNILPAPIAERLKDNEELIVDRFEDASVLFADIVGFTKFSAKRSPDEVVDMLNRLFSEFDAMCERLGLEKIKTIGDAYMVAGGLPVANSEHPALVARMAIEMQRIVARQLYDGVPLQTRIGIHCGPVIAGVIGTRKFIYDLWGDTVNTASRMESSGRDGKIQVSEVFYQRIKNQFQCSEPRIVNVKGKGEMTCYELIAE